jgi:hypothetical protein
VPLAGFEPARCCHHQILSLARLPVPPQGHWVRISAIWGGDHSDGSPGVNVIGFRAILPPHRLVDRQGGAMALSDRCFSAGIA